MFSYFARSLPYRFQALLSSLLLSESLPFSEVLSQEQIQSVCDEHGVDFGEEQVYTPAITLWAFLSQVIHKEEQRSCLPAVERIGTLLVAFGRACCCLNNSGSYCRARGLLPCEVVKDLAVKTASSCQENCDAAWAWYGRPVSTVDGTTVTMPDTDENQEKYPQQSSQKVGLGFPIARMVMCFSLATGMLQGMAMGPYRGKETGETALLRQLMHLFGRGSIALMDKIYCNYWTIAALYRQSADVVTLYNAARHLDLSQAKRVGKNEYEHTWERPQRPAWMDRVTYQKMPETLTLRLIKAKIRQRGFRVKTMMVVTTLLDVKRYPRDEVVALYRQRWSAELDIRAIKVNLGMNDLRCKSPEMVEKEIWTCLLAYNLIRLKLLQAAKQHGKIPLHLSFTFGLQTLAVCWTVGLLLNETGRNELDRVNLQSMAGRQVGDRPDRVEPRAVKQRPKPLPLLTMTRKEARAHLLNGIDPYKKQK